MLVLCDGCIYIVESFELFYCLERKKTKNDEVVVGLVKMMAKKNLVSNKTKQCTCGVPTHYHIFNFQHFTYIVLGLFFSSNNKK